MPSRYELFCSSISSIYHFIQKIERAEMANYGCKGTFAQYLAALHRYPEGMTATQLCESCDRDKAAVSRAVSEMEHMGLIVRSGTQDNMYRARLRLTDEGRQAAEYVCRRAQSAVDAGSRGLTDDERCTLYSVLGRIAGNLEIISRLGLPYADDMEDEE